MKTLHPQAPSWSRKALHSPIPFGWAALVMVTGCAVAPHQASSPFDREAQRTIVQEMDVTVMVQNEHWRSMRVWLNWPGMRHFFLGEVSPGAVAEFRIPSELVRMHGSFRFHAGASGLADEVFTEPISLRGNHRVELFLHRVLASSKTRVR